VKFRDWVVSFEFRPSFGHRVNRSIVLSVVQSSRGAFPPPGIAVDAD